MSKKQIIDNAALTVRVAEPVGEVIEGVEAAVETVQNFGGTTHEVAEEAVTAVVKAYRNNPWVLAGVGIAALSTGLYVGYRYGIKKASLHFDSRLEEETEAMRTFYQRLAREGEFKTPESAVKALVPAEQAAAALQSYRAPEDGTVLVQPVQESTDRTGEVRTVQTSVTVAKAPVEEVTTNVFTQAREGLPVWDQIAELQKRAELPDGWPYIISLEEYNENEGGNNQEQLTYFAGDDTLVDSKEMPIEGSNELVGDDNLLQFGHGSNNHNVVYVRNDNLSVDMEIIRHDGTFAKAVHGFDPEVMQNLSRQPRRMRSADE